MSFCLGKRSRWGPERLWPPIPRTHALCQGKNVGRPKVYEPRCHQLNISLTATEQASITARATALGMRPAPFGRALLLARDSSPSARQPQSNHKQLIYGQLVRLGNNLNQLVRRLHQTGEPVPADLEPLLRDIRHIITREGGDDR
jgi:hypothetical protein